MRKYWDVRGWLCQAYPQIVCCTESRQSNLPVLQEKDAVLVTQTRPRIEGLGRIPLERYQGAMTFSILFRPYLEEMPAKRGEMDETLNLLAAG